MVEMASCAIDPPLEYIRTTRDSILTSNPMQIDVTRKIAGRMVIVMSVSFHWAVRATIKAAKNMEIYWMRNASLSAIPLLMREPLVVTSTATDDGSLVSKCQISFVIKL